jgi:PAS domain S-box-containing protein
MTQDVLTGKLTRWTLTLLCVLVLASALLALGGRVAGAPRLASFGFGPWPMSPVSSALVTLLSLSVLLAFCWGDRPAVRRLALLMAALAMLVAAVSLADRLPGGHPVLGGRVMAIPRALRSSILSSLAAFGTAFAMILRWAPSQPSRPWRQRAALAAQLPLGIGMVVLIAHMAGARLLYEGQPGPMSFPSAVASFGLGAALSLAAGFDVWPLALFGLPSEDGPASEPGRSDLGPLLMFVASMALILGFAHLFLRGQTRTAKAKAQEELSAVADQKARQISLWYSQRVDVAKRMRRIQLVQSHLSWFLSGSSEAPTRLEVQSLLEGLQLGTFSRVTLFDARGRVRMTVPQDGALTAAETRDADLALQSEEVLVSDLHRDQDHTGIRLNLWVPITHGKRAHTGADGLLLFSVDPSEFLYPLIKAWPMASESAETNLIRREEKEAVHLNDPRHHPDAALNFRFSLDKAPRLARMAANGEEGQTVAQDYRGVPVVGAVRRVAGTPWSMVVKMDEAEIYGPLRRQAWISGIALFALMGASALGTGLMVRHRDGEVARARLAEAKRFEWLMREASDIILMMDGEGQILEANAQAVEQYGYGHAELLGMNITALRLPESLGEAEEQFRNVRVEGSMRFETLHRRKDGTRFPVEVSSRSIQLAEGQRVISFVRDITERRAQELEVRRLAGLYAALGRVNEAIVRSPTRELLFDRVCQAMVESGRFATAWIGWNDPATHLVSVSARYGDFHGALDRMVIRSDDTPEGRGAVGTAIRLECPTVFNDFLNTPESGPWRSVLAEAGFLSVAAFPIREAGEVRGVLTVFASEEDFFGTQEAQLLDEAAMDISYALDHQAEEARRRRAETALAESERFLAEAQEAGEIGTYTLQIQEDLWKSSPFLDRIFGIGTGYPRNLSGWLATVAPEFRQKMEAYISGIIERHERFDLDYPIIRVSDGALRWVHGQGDIQWSGDGQAVALVGVVQDITERKKAERTLREISMAVEQSPTSIMITDASGAIEYVNPAFTEVTGYTAVEVIGQNPRILKPPSAPPERYQELWKTLARGETWVGEFENRKKNGDLFQERATIAPVRDEAGVLTGYIALKEDITRQKRHEEERRLLEAQLHESQKLESLGSLAGGVAHDMNNVLGAILGLASSMREAVDPFSAEAKNFDTIVNACMRGRGVVKSLLYFAHKDLQEEQSINLNSLVKEMTQLLSYTTLKRVKVSMDLQRGLGAVRGDAGALGHALMNLCVNAMDAMPGGGTLIIQTAASQDGGVTLLVKDTGEGMPPGVLAKAMEPFFTTKPQGKGTGLGLAMVYGTMKAHEGAFELRSRPGEGTEAILRFPASRVERPIESPAPVPVVAEPPRVSLKILLVDDDDLIRESVVPTLEMLGHVVTAAPGGAQALRMLEEGLPVDLVILDMNMPGMSGAEALPLILHLRPGTPVLMASGYSEQEIAPLLEGRPRVYSLRKPFSMKEVQQKITELGISLGSDPLA